MPAYTPSQLAAIQEIDQNLQIIACAGSGKTQVISARVIEILKRKKDAGVGPTNIVAFTFTDKAAAEVKAFLEALNVIREDNADRSKLPPGLKAALDAYTDLLDKHRYLDYSRIMVEAVAALYDPDGEANLALQEKIGERVKYLIVDEY